MKRLIFILVIMPTFLFSQGWEKTYGFGTGNSVEQTIDGGFIVIGSGYNTGQCTFMIKTDQHGDTLWTKHHSVNTRELFPSGHQTADGGYVITGLTDLTDSFYSDVFLLKTDFKGDTLWSKVYGGDKDDVGLSIQQTEDGGYIITGWSESFSSTHNVYLIKTDSIGELMWDKTYGDDNQNTGRSVQQTNDGGYFITGSTYIAGSGFAWVSLIKTDSIGDILWTSIYDDEEEDFGESGQQTNDGGFIITGSTEASNNILDILLMKTFINGEIDWVRTYGESSKQERGSCVKQTNDGGYIITGTKKTDNYSYDVYLIKTDSFGDTLWTRTFGGDNWDGGSSVQQTTEGGYIITGVYQNESDVRFVYLIKTNEDGIITFSTEIPYTNPSKKLIKMVDFSGKEIFKPKKNQPYIELYEDGTTKKKMTIN